MAQRAPVRDLNRSGPVSRIPPHNLDAEQSVLGAMLESKDAISNVIGIIKADDFYKPAHTEIYEAISVLYNSSESVDAITVAEELSRRGSLENIGGKPYIHGLLEAYPTASSAARYAAIVEENARLRRLVSAGNEIQEIGFSLPEDVDQAVDQAEEIIYNVADRRLKDTLNPLRELLTENMIQIEMLAERGESVTGVTTGFPDLDEITSGFQPSNFIIVAARPGMGKSALLNDFALAAAMRQSQPVLMFNLEMSRHELTKRFLASEAKVDSQRMSKGTMQEQDWNRLSSALGRLAEAPIFIDDSANITLMEIRAKCRRLKAKKGLGLVIIDYLQLMQSPRRSENRQQEVSDISRNLKILARELEVPVICAAQLNRGVEYRQDKRPFLGDLRESGCLTADTRVMRSDTGAMVTMGELFTSGERNIPVWTVDDDLKMVKGTMTHVFSSGVKKVFKMRMRSGREVKASANHPFLTYDGWKALERLEIGDGLAIPRTIREPTNHTDWADEQVILLAHLIGDGSHLARLPLRYATQDQENIDAVVESAKFFGVEARVKWEEAARSYQVFLPSPYRVTHGRRNPINQWLDDLGLYDKRSYEKFIPDEVFGLPNRQLALFLRHLWATDGSINLRKSGATRAPSAYYATTSRRLADDVSALLMRFGVVAATTTARKATFRDGYQVRVRSGRQLQRFLNGVGAFGPKVAGARLAQEYLDTHPRKWDADMVPANVWQDVIVSQARMGLTMKAMRDATTVDFRPTFHRYGPMQRQTCGELAALLQNEHMATAAESEVFWDEIISIEYIGDEEVFDATVPGTHNFVADGIIAHNSLEQDSDVVMFIYRDEVYNFDTEHRGEAELIIAKHRNGPTGVVRLAFMNQFTKFASMARVPGAR